MSNENFNSGLISVDDHVQEPPELWTRRLSNTRWADRVPHLETQPDGTQYWIVDGSALPLSGVGLTGALMDDRTRVPQRWEEVPEAAYLPEERLRAMDADGVAYSVLYPTVAGLSGENLGRLTDADLRRFGLGGNPDYLLIEFPYVGWPLALPQHVFDLVSRGIIPVIFQIARSMNR